jgi:hypothetical protein
LRPQNWKPSRIVLVCFTLFLVAGPSAAFQSRVRWTDQEVLRIDRATETLARTTEQACSDDGCTDVESFWGSDGRIRKIIDQVGASDLPGVTRTRFFNNCQLILTRLAPNDPAAAREPKNIQRFYFKNGKLIQILFGDQRPQLPESEIAYYARAMHVEARVCTMDGVEKKKKVDEPVGEK